MATKIRLQRHGKKGKAFFHIVAADTRAKRDGKFIEKLGIYNPNTDPATIEINFDRTLNWVQVGAEMSDTAKAILSYKGVLYKNHLIKGIKKGALTEAQVEEKFAKWLEEKESKVGNKREKLSKEAIKAKADKLKAEAEIAEKRAKEIEAKNSPEAAVVEEAPVAEVTEDAPVAAESVEETVAEAPVAEEVVEETPAVEEVEEAPAAEEVTEEAPVAEATEEAPVAEESSEEEEKKAE